MKNVKRFSIGLVFAIFLVTGTMVNSAAAVELTSSITLPWKTEYVVNDGNVSAVTLALHPATQRPLVAFHDVAAGSFSMAKRVGAGLGDCGPGDTWDCWPVHPTSVGLFDGDYWSDPTGQHSRAGFVHYDSVGRSLRYTYYFSNGSGWDKLMEFDSDLDWNIGSKPSIAYDHNGNPHVVVTVDTPDEFTLLAYFHYTGDLTDTSCTGYWKGSLGWECEFIIIGQNAVDDPSITVNDFNLPRIAYHNPATHELMYTYETDKFPSEACLGNANWRCAVVDSDLLTGYYPSIAYGDGKLFIAYSNGSLLRLAEYVGSGGNCVGNGSWKCITIDDIANGYIPVDLTLAMDGHQPVIAYQDTDDSMQVKIKLAQTAFRAGLDAGNCGPETPFSTWSCQVIDQGPYDLGNDLDMMINSSGLVSIAYLEDNYDQQQQHVLFSYQYLPVFLPLITR